MLVKKRQNLTRLLMRIESVNKDSFGIWEVGVRIDTKLYTYPLTSEFAVRKVSSLIRQRKYGKAIQVLHLFCTPGFNYWKEELTDGSESGRGDAIDRGIDTSNRGC